MEMGGDVCVQGVYSRPVRLGRVLVVGPAMDGRTRALTLCTPQMLQCWDLTPIPVC
jgi:hypothetical protein